MSVKKLVEINPNVDVEYKSVNKLILQKAETLREGLKNLYPSKFFLVVEHSQLLQNLIQQPKSWAFPSLQVAFRDPVRLYRCNAQN